MNAHPAAQMLFPRFGRMQRKGPGSSIAHLNSPTKHTRQAWPLPVAGASRTPILHQRRISAFTAPTIPDRQVSFSQLLLHRKEQDERRVRDLPLPGMPSRAPSPECSGREDLAGRGQARHSHIPGLCCRDCLGADQPFPAFQTCLAAVSGKERRRERMSEMEREAALPRSRAWIFARAPGCRRCRRRWASGPRRPGIADRSSTTRRPIACASTARTSAVEAESAGAVATGSSPLSELRRGTFHP